MSAILTFCKQAKGELKYLSNRFNKSPLMIGVKSGGCNGLKYFIEPKKDPPSKNDIKIDLDGTDIIVCGKSSKYLLGTEITWKADTMGSRFEFNNPNATGCCGCGETFSM